MNFELMQNLVSFSAVVAIGMFPNSLETPIRFILLTIACVRDIRIIVNNISFLLQDSLEHKEDNHEDDSTTTAVQRGHFDKTPKWLKATLIKKNRPGTFENGYYFEETARYLTRNQALCIVFRFDSYWDSFRVYIERIEFPMLQNCLDLQGMELPYNAPPDSYSLAKDIAAAFSEEFSAKLINQNMK